MLKFIRKNANFWGKPEFQPIWWPEDVPFNIISRKSTKSILQKIIKAYLDSQRSSTKFSLVLNL